jgi:SAM-dependent methyltransferase
MLADLLFNPLTTLMTGRRPERPDLERPWRVWDLDSELRYLPVVRALPASPLPLCEVGSGPHGLAVWTDREVVGVDPGDDGRHAGLLTASPPNLRRLEGDGANLPLRDASVAAAVAVDTLEHIPRAERPAVIAEMLRVTAPGGRVILMGPAGPDAAEGDAYLLARHRERGAEEGPVVWLSEHLEHGLPTVDELVGLLAQGRTTRITAKGVFNLAMWRVMHRAALADYPQPRGAHLVHHLAWAPFGALARRLRRGPYYRWLVVAELG